MRQFGELEAVIVDRLWQRGRPALVREVLDDLREDRPLAYTTVMTVMENLYRKGWLRRDRDGRAWRYEPTRSRSAYTAALMSDALATGTDRRVALAHFVLQMSPHDAALLQQALNQAHPLPGGRRDTVTVRAVRRQAVLHAQTARLVGRPDPDLGAMLVDHAQPVAYCVTGPHPTVILTTAALQALDPDQVDAVLAHERAHLASHHHRLLAIARIGRQVLPFLPLMRVAETQITRLVEMHADDAATAGRDTGPLAAALVVLAAAAGPTPGLAAATTDAVQRIQRLLRPAEPLSRLRRQLLGAGAAVLALTPLLLALTPAIVAVALGHVPAA